MVRTRLSFDNTDVLVYFLKDAERTLASQEGHFLKGLVSNVFFRLQP
jgi:hypothetical protein